MSAARHVWRRLERALVAYLKSCRIHVIDDAAEPHFDAVRYFEGEEVVTLRLSLEDLAKHLADEIPASSGETCRAFPANRRGRND
jgi:hypothetical protein